MCVPWRACISFCPIIGSLQALDAWATWLQKQGASAQRISTTKMANSSPIPNNRHSFSMRLFVQKSKYTSLPNFTSSTPAMPSLLHACQCNALQPLSWHVPSYSGEKPPELQGCVHLSNHGSRTRAWEHCGPCWAPACSLTPGHVYMSNRGITTEECWPKNAIWAVTQIRHISYIYFKKNCRGVLLSNANSKNCLNKPGLPIDEPLKVFHW